MASGICASGKVSRSLSTHCRRTRIIAQCPLRKSAPSKTIQAKPGSSQATQGTCPADPRKKARTTAGSPGPNQAGSQWWNAFAAKSK